ncbi:MAG: dephospho-CoA kinase [Bacteroidia bacterium]|nr:dephospho-CoA kinase [Bacteroidia bacterium]MBT8268845.1 dephospho-CoA kinase [Bacteroidia bacterium]NNF83333.1 dephospho-CoA kinase [Flavobacteriaceae bacterium]NNK70208.1 dephospho-CoA kinase [Flavobacteriaceae bacterium]NNL79151.1 dephospho-CoA kinase [Flavobacteriaceae bacterium]
MKIVGLTGGIGSGKSTVAEMFSELGVPTYDADSEAKGLMNRSKVIRRKLMALFGDKAYNKEGLNKPFLAKKIFNDEALLEQMNAIVHPKVASHFRRWVKQQKSAYVIKEAAILFESGSYKDCDLIITVTAPQVERIKRVIKRDKSNKERVRAIMKNQWSDKKRIAKSHYTIVNTDLEKTRQQVAEIHTEILCYRQ